MYAFTCVCVKAYPVDPLSIHTSKHRTQTQTFTQRHTSLTQHLRNTQTNNTYKSFTKQAGKENRHNTAFAKKTKTHTITEQDSRQTDPFNPLVSTREDPGGQTATQTQPTGPLPLETTISPLNSLIYDSIKTSVILR